MRIIATLIIAALALAGIAASDRKKPLLVEAHSSGAWDFNNAAAPAHMPQEHRLFAVCPTTPWALPKSEGTHQA